MLSPSCKGGDYVTSAALSILQVIFQTIWRFFNSWYIPGTHATPASWFFFLAFAGIILRFLGRVQMTYHGEEDKPLDGIQAHYHLPPGRGK